MRSTLRQGDALATAEIDAAEQGQRAELVRYRDQLQAELNKVGALLRGAPTGNRRQRREAEARLRSEQRAAAKRAQTVEGAPCTT